MLLSGFVGAPVGFRLLPSCFSFHFRSLLLLRSLPHSALEIPRRTIGQLNFLMWLSLNPCRSTVFAGFRAHFPRHWHVFIKGFLVVTATRLPRPMMFSWFSALLLRIVLRIPIPKCFFFFLSVQQRMHLLVCLCHLMFGCSFCNGSLIARDSCLVECSFCLPRTILMCRHEIPPRFILHFFGRILPPIVGDFGRVFRKLL
mmetsp:Transcript_101746/g.164037  ORF Transcript_101746/g.164037 Transcript_101746/m.164037 type:complete len:200 (+) Transcript_101746:541-1140(+)